MYLNFFECHKKKTQTNYAATFVAFIRNTSSFTTASDITLSNSSMQHQFITEVVLSFFVLFYTLSRSRATLFIVIIFVLIQIILEYIITHAMLICIRSLIEDKNRRNRQW